MSKRCGKPSTTTIARYCFGRQSRPRSATWASNASLKGATGSFRDAELAYRSWDFDVTKIERPVHMWQGTDDALVPAVINQTVAERMPGTVWHSVAGGGHSIAVGAADEIFAITAQDLGA